MKFRVVFSSLLVLSCTATGAANPEAAGTVVINGKTTNLAHGRAWQNGVAMGIPLVSVILSEKPLTDLDWWKGDSNFGEGQRGAALRIDPSPDPSSERDKPPYRYRVSEDYEIKLHAADFRGWNAATLTKEIQVQEITVKDGWVRGKVEWKGTLANPFDETQTITAFSATFHLPMEEMGPMPTE